MAEYAFESEELGLTEAERASARHQLREIRAGRLGDPPRPTPAAELCALIRKNGALPGYLESAWLLPLDEYDRVKEVYKQTGPPDRPKIRRKR